MKYVKFSNMKTLLLITLFTVSNYFCDKQIAPDAIGKEYITIVPRIYEKAFPNPLKGFRSSTVLGEDYPTLTRLYIKWNEIENSESDGVDKIISFCNEKWKELPARNVKVIPRVYLEWPYNVQNEQKSRDTVASDWGSVRYCERYWPADMVRGDYSSEQFKARLTALINKMGIAWDNDPRVAYIEMGLIGWWGEQHSPFITPELQKLIGDAFTSAFKTKLVMVRQAKDFTGYPFGSYWDSFAHSGQVAEANQLVAQGIKWETTVRGGEVAYDWGDRSKTGMSPDESLKNKMSREYVIDYIRRVHCNHLGWINRYNSTDPEISKGADEVQKNLGYRFVIDEVSYIPGILPGDKLQLKFTVRNIGSSPFYYNWPVEVSLLDPATKQPVWKNVFSNVDLRKWFPGDQWNPQLRKYDIPAKSNIVSGEFDLPVNLAKGEYILALAILDPAGNVPAVRFAIKNYFMGGRHPIGKIGFDKAVRDYKLDDKTFNDLYADRSLYYVVKN